MLKQAKEFAYTQHKDVNINDAEEFANFEGKIHVFLLCQLFTKH